MEKNITYITYQTFPAHTANSIQTMTHIKHFSKLNWKVKLIYPLRNKESNDNLEDLKNFYQIKYDFDVHGTIHPLPFKKITIFEKFNYLISHLIWSYAVTRKIKKNSIDKFFTRSEWVFYFLSRKNCRVVYECHQLTNLKKNLITKSTKNKNSKLILLNSSMSKELNNIDNRQAIVLSSAYDEDIFRYNEKENISKKIIYVGSFFRFGISRGVESLLKLSDKLKDYDVKIVVVANDIENLSQFTNIKYDEIDFYSNLKREEISNLFQECSVGLLINNESQHAEKYTSPLKYFEYISSGLNVVATENESHKKLPFDEKLFYFTRQDDKSFIDAVLKAFDTKTSIPKDLDVYSMSNRVEKIIELYI